MPYIFPPIQSPTNGEDPDPIKRMLQSYASPQVVSGGALGNINQAPPTPTPSAPDSFQSQPNVPVPNVLGRVEMPSRSSLALNGADNDLQAAKDKMQADTPRPYDFHAHGFAGNTLHVLGRVGNIAGDILDPAATSLIPNSDLYNAHKLAGDQDNVDKATATAAGAQRESDSVDNEQTNRAITERGQDFDEQKYTDAGPQRQATLANTQLEGSKTQQEVDDLKLNNKPLDTAGVSNLNDIYANVLKSAGIKAPMFREGMSPVEVQRSIQSLEHIFDQGQKDREFRLAQAVLALQRQVANNNREDAREQHEGDTGRKLLDGAEKTYNTATQSTNQMDQFINLAEAGNKAAGQMVPLEGALEITSANGVHRINRTEVDQYAGAGNLYDKVHGELSKLTSGQPIPPNVLGDMRKLSDVLRQGAYGTYRSTFDSAQKRYGLSNETPLQSPGGPAASITPQGATGKAPGNDGHMYFHDAKGNNLGRAD